MTDEELRIADVISRLTGETWYQDTSYDDRPVSAAEGRDYHRYLVVYANGDAWHVRCVSGERDWNAVGYLQANPQQFKRLIRSPFESMI